MKGGILFFIEFFPIIQIISPSNFYSLSSNHVVRICNGNRTAWSPIRSEIIRVITKSDNRAAREQFT